METLKNMLEKLTKLSRECRYLEAKPGLDEGLKKVLNYYKKEPNELYVIGDSGNDIPMFDAFYHNSFCMNHAVEHVRCHAKHTVKRVYALEEYLD